MIRRVTSIEFDGPSITSTFGRHEVPTLKVSYGDSLETEVVKEMGSQRQAARTPGTYKTDSISITFRTSRFRSQILARMPKHGFGNVKMPIVVGYNHPEIGVDSDLLVGCRCVNLAAAIEASAKALEVETKWECDQIMWTSKRITINILTGQLVVGASSL